MSKILFTTPVVATAGIHTQMMQNKNFEQFVTRCLVKHFSGDFGSIPEDEKEMNLIAIKNKIDRVFSVYENSSDTKIYIITDGEPRHTTVLFPHEY